MNNFSKLTPDDFLPALEEALGEKLTALVRSLPSYINRVYEIQTIEEVSYIAKFYRPGRWSVEALRDEHAFILDCTEAEIPVACPLKLKSGDTLGKLDEIVFCVFPKRAGRQFDVESNESWQRVGTLLGRLHNVGRKRPAPARLNLTPAETTRKHVDQMIDKGVSPNAREGFSAICNRIIEFITPYFEGSESIRLHGDFHPGNILHRPGEEQLMVIDFDDMMNGPAVQDFWLLLPDHYPASKPCLDQLLIGYGQFRDIDPRWPLLIEGLRAMRMIYFTAWCNMQRDDYQFQDKFPDWGSEKFWNKEIRDLHVQYEKIVESVMPA